MYTVSISDKIAAAHFLEGYEGKCAGLHGHTWKIVVRVAAHELNATGILIDFYELKEIVHTVIDRFDHKNLNELAFFSDMNPSTENLARLCYEMIKEKLPECLALTEIELFESEGCSVTYTE